MSKEVKTILLASLIVMAFTVVITVQKQASAELSLKQKLWVDNAVRLGKGHLIACNSLLDDPNYNLTAGFPNMNMTQAVWLCDDSIIIIPTVYCTTTKNDSATSVELVQRFMQSGLCEDPLLSKYIGERNLWDRVQTTTK